MINHCDRHITLLSHTDISFGLFNLFTYFDMPFGWVTNTLNVKEILKIYLIEKKIYLNHQNLSDCTIYIGGITDYHCINFLTIFETRGSVGWACVAHLSFCFEET